MLSISRVCCSDIVCAVFVSSLIFSMSSCCRLSTSATSLFSPFTWITSALYLDSSSENLRRIPDASLHILRYRMALASTKMMILLANLRKKSIVLRVYSSASTSFLTVL